MNTPWGKSDSKIEYGIRGLSFVSTPSHGGFAITERVGRQLLSVAAQSRGQFRNGYFFFEEDCDAFIVLLEVPQTRGSVDLTKATVGLNLSEATIVNSLSQWHADYLIERGIQPTAEGLKFFNDNRQQDRMRQDKSPDLIVSAVGDWHKECPKDMVLVTTADDQKYLVWASEYDNRSNLNLLSNYTSVKVL